MTSTTNGSSPPTPVEHAEDTDTQIVDNIANTPVSASAPPPPDTYAVPDKTRKAGKDKINARTKGDVVKPALPQKHGRKESEEESDYVNASKTCVKVDKLEDYMKKKKEKGLKDEYQVNTYTFM